MSAESVSLRTSEPIFPVADVVATVRYFRDVLGFIDEWLWGDPPDFGGVRWGKIGVMFAQHPGRDATVGGHWHAFMVDKIDVLYDLHTRKGAVIHSPLETKPWGLREYTVRDLNGHYLRFGHESSDRSATSGRSSATAVEIVKRLPTVEEYQALVRAVGWAATNPLDRAANSLAGVRSGVIARDGDRVVGAGLVIGDGTTFAYLKDIMVHPDWQGRGIGTRIVGALLAEIRENADDPMLVALFTGRRLAPFYEQFGFLGPEEALYGMSMHIKRNDR
jgi:GNAT superfamily N-acetyltransferase